MTLKQKSALYWAISGAVRGQVSCVSDKQCAKILYKVWLRMGKMEDTIAPAELRRKLASGEQVIILDVREPYEFAARHIPQAVNYPVSRLTVPVKLPKGLVVTVCEHGVRSEAACWPGQATR
jgi:hypothetical protein